MKKSTLVIPFLALAGLVAQSCSSFPGLPRKNVAAQVGSKTITVEEIDTAIQPELTRIEGERYEARKSKLDQLIEDALVADKAKALGVSKEELIKQEVTDKAKAPTDDDVKATYEKFKGQLGAFDAVAPRIKDMLTAQAATARRSEFVGELRKQAQVSVKLQPPRMHVDVAGGHANGPEGAPITFIEFSDYQCPFCGRSQATVDQVLDKYKGKIRHVFMDFPLTSIHPNAMPAAVASRCAEEQGKYEEYHKLLFEHQRELSADNFKKWAGDLSLDQAKFDACLGSKKFDAAINQSVQIGQKIGLTGTPGFFINGIAIKGAQPFDVFQRTIDDELARAK